MKKTSWALLCNLLLLLFCFSCSQADDHNIKIKISESEHYYKMLAHFNKWRTQDVDAFMNDKIGYKNNISFKHTEIDAKITLDDQTTFYIKKSPGYLRLEFDKSENSTDAYQQVKTMCEGIKKIVSQ